MLLKSLMCAHATLHSPTCRHFLLLPKHLTVTVPLPEMIEPGRFGCDQQSHSLTCAAFEWLSGTSSERMPPGTGGGAGKASLLIRPVKGLKKKCRPSRAVTLRHSGCSAELDCSCSPKGSVLCQNMQMHGSRRIAVQLVCHDHISKACCFVGHGNDLAAQAHQQGLQMTCCWCSRATIHAAARFWYGRSFGLSLGLFADSSGSLPCGLTAAYNSATSKPTAA